MNEVLNQAQDWYNNNVAIANSSGLVSMMLTIVYMKLSSMHKKKAQAITIDVNSATTDVKALTTKVDQLSDNQVKNNQALQNVNRMILAFSLSTNIDSQTKKEIIDLYNDIKNNAIELTKESKQLIESTVEKAKEIVEEVIENVAETKVETKSIMNKYREELK